MQKLNIHEAKTKLSAVLSQVEKGESFIICRNGKPIANLIPAPESEANRGASGDRQDPHQLRSNRGLVRRRVGRDQLMLLDTCALLWLTHEQENLSPEIWRQIDEVPILHISAATSFEIGLKARAGKLLLPVPQGYGWKPCSRITTYR